MSTTPAHRTVVRPPLPMRSKAAFGLGDFASQLTWSLVSSYLVVYYTDVALIPAGIAGVILLVARIVDAIADPTIGYIAERTHSRWGRFRPYIMFGAPPLALLTILTFWSPNASQGIKVAWALATYLLMGILYSVVNMLYGALAGVMTTDYQERLDLNWFRGIGGGLGSIVLNAVTMPLILHFSGGDHANGRGYLWTAAILALVSIPMFWGVAANCKEVINPEPGEAKVPVKETARAVLGNGPLMAVAGSLLLLLLGLFGRLGVVVYYIMNNMHAPQKIAVVMTAFGLASTAGQIVFPKFAAKFGKKQVVIFSQLWGALALFAIYFAPATNHNLIIGLTVLYGLSGFAGPITLSMIPDAVDHGELKTGIRSDGTAYAAVSLATKISSAAGAAVGAFIIGAFGYIANTPATPRVLTGINIATNLVPAILAVVASGLMLFYHLDEKTVRANREELDRRGAAKAAALDETAAAAPSVAFAEVDPAEAVKND